MRPGQRMAGKTVSLNTVLEYVDKPDIEDQQYPIEVIRHRVTDVKRSALARRAKQARVNMQEKCLTERNR